MPALPKENRTETVIGAFILVVLGFIGLFVFNSQSNFNPAVVALQVSAEKNEVVQPVQKQLLLTLPAGIKPISAPEQFDSDTLFEKINGAAEAYLAAGFVELKSQRYALVDNPDSWLEVFVYDMGSAKNAFSIFSTQRRSDAMAINIGQFDYGTENALFIVQGRFYVQIIAATTQDELYKKMKEIAAGFVKTHPVAQKKIAGIGWFPETGLDKKSVSLVSTDAFGFEGFNDVFTAYYTSANLTAFVSQRDSDQAAQEKAAAFYRFFKQFGGKDQNMDISIQGARMVEIMESYTVIFSNGNFVAGVQEAQDKKTAVQMAEDLNRKLSEVGRGQ
jgi:hypothetical protein